MKSKIVILLALSLVLLSFQFKTNEKETRNLKAFNEIELAISADLYITQGAPQKVEIEADSDDLKEIETKVNGSTLEIKTKSNWANLGKVKIYITVPEINGLHIAGSGNIWGESTLKNDKISLSIAGSGSIHLKKLEISKVHAEIAGSGDIKIAGKNATTLNSDISGSGNIDSQNMAFDEVSISVAGSGDVFCKAIKKLNASLVGSGDVHYLGNPVINVESVGSGKVKQIE